MCVCVCVCFCVHAHVLSCVQLFAATYIVALQAPLSMEFSRQEYWSGLPSPTPGDLPSPGIELHLLHLLHWQADSLPLCHLGAGVQPQLIQGIRRRDGIGKGQETTA